MSHIEFSKEQLSGPKNVLGYPETPYKSPQVESTKQSKIIFEAPNHKSSTSKKSK